jgi:hypothetical protein
MAVVNLSLTPEERALLVRLLEIALGETRVELRHTHYSPAFREEVKHEEDLIRDLLQKVRQAPA